MKVYQLEISEAHPQPVRFVEYNINDTMSIYHNIKIPLNTLLRNKVADCRFSIQLFTQD